MKITFRQLLLVASVAWLPATAEAVTIPMTLDSAQSSISLNLFLGTAPFSPQGPGSTSASYSGSMLVDVDDYFAPTTIQILGSSAAASITGSWVPEAGGGPAIGNPGVAQDANYGFQINLGGIGNAWIALRDVEFDVTSGVEPVAGGAFASTQNLEVASGLLVFNAPAALGGVGQQSQAGDSLTNASAAMSTYSVAGLTATLTIPINITDPGNPSAVYAGQLVATARVPEPSSFVLVVAVLAGSCGMAIVGRRRQSGAKG